MGLGGLELFVAACFVALCAYAWAHVSAFAVDLIDPDGGLIFSFWGRWLDSLARAFEQAGNPWAAFWLKPLGLCGWCFTTWLAIGGAVCCSRLYEAPLELCLVFFVGANYKVFGRNL